MKHTSSPKPLFVHNRLNSKDAYSSSNPLVQWIFYKRFEKIYGSIVKNNFCKEKVLDAGCGCGIFLPTLSKTFQIVYALDLPDRMDVLEPTISEILEEYNCSNVVLVRGDVTKLSKIFARDFFDCIVCADVLEHLEVPMKALLEFGQCLKPEGSLEFSIPTETKLYKFLRTLASFPRPSHYEQYDFRLLLKEIEKVFEPRKLQAIPPLLSLFICGSVYPR